MGKNVTHEIEIENETKECQYFHPLQTQRQPWKIAAFLRNMELAEGTVRLSRSDGKGR